MKCPQCGSPHVKQIDGGINERLNVKVCQCQKCEHQFNLTALEEALENLLPSKGFEESIINFDHYQEFTDEVADYPTEKGKVPMYPALGLAGEAGEVCDNIKKIHRDDGGTLTEARRQKLRGELGDTLWYLARIAIHAGFSLSDIASYNINKLRDRKARGKIHGDGDER